MFTSGGRPKRNPNNFSIFKEVPHDARAREKIVNLTVEWQEGASSEQ